MNKTTNQYINALHLDPKKEVAVRKIIENAGGINDSTPIVDTISGNELIPINVDGENKAVSAAALVKGAKEVYSIKTSEFKTSENFNNLEAAVDAGNVIIVDGIIINAISKGSSNNKPIIGAITNFAMDTYSNNKHEYITFYLDITFNSDGTYDVKNTQTALKSGYDGTKFLSDDGTYKEISKEIFIVTSDMFEQTATTDEQPSPLTFTDEGWTDFIEAVEANKLIVLDIAVASYIISNSTPYGIATMKGYFVLSYVTHVDDIVQGYFNVDMGEGIISYNIQIINKSLTSTMKFGSNSSSEPVIIEIEDFDSTTQLNDKQIEAVINQNIKIVVEDTVSNISIYITPYTYAISGNQVILLCTVLIDKIQTIGYIINITDKTMSKLSL